jgi:uroporphyrin-III C-methyltransferase
MGLHNLPAIAAKLIAYGRSLETPVALIHWGTTNEQETVIGTLADIVEKSAPLKAPVLIVVGDVVNLRSKLDWFAPRAGSSDEVWPLGEAELVGN